MYEANWETNIADLGRRAPILAILRPAEVLNLANIAKIVLSYMVIYFIDFIWSDWKLDEMYPENPWRNLGRCIDRRADKQAWSVHRIVFSYKRYYCIARKTTDNDTMTKFNTGKSGVSKGMGKMYGQIEFGNI